MFCCSRSYFIVRGSFVKNFYANFRFVCNIHVHIYIYIKYIFQREGEINHVLSKHRVYHEKSTFGDVIWIISANNRVGVWILKRIWSRSVAGIIVINDGVSLIIDKKKTHVTQFYVSVKRHLKRVGDLYFISPVKKTTKRGESAIRKFLSVQ